jgi:hypothetical protein
MNIEVGKLYYIPDEYILLVPNREDVLLRIVPTQAKDFAEYQAETHSKTINKKIEIYDPNEDSVVLVLRKENNYIEILVGNKKGWFFFYENEIEFLEVF